MTITREDLKNLYLEHIESERIRLSKIIEEDYKSMIQNILEANKQGKSRYQQKTSECSEIYINLLLNKIQHLFVDSKITTEMIKDEQQSNYIIITIDWSQ